MKLAVVPSLRRIAVWQLIECRQALGERASSRGQESALMPPHAQPMPASVQPARACPFSNAADIGFMDNESMLELLSGCGPEDLARIEDATRWGAGLGGGKVCSRSRH